MYKEFNCFTYYGSHDCNNCGRCLMDCEDYDLNLDEPVVEFETYIEPSTDCPF